jgi:hypothetical protein
MMSPSSPCAPSAKESFPRRPRMWAACGPRSPTWLTISGGAHGRSSGNGVSSSTACGSTPPPPPPPPPPPTSAAQLLGPTDSAWG